LQVWLDYILSLPDPLPSVVSTSYDDDEQTVPYDYAVSVCHTLAQLGARGVSVLFASGDNGIGRDGYCVSNDGKNTSTFLPNFPSSCPYITSVGGTYKFNPEVAVYRARPGRPIYTAGGGFSYYFKRPSYQDKAVPAYVANVLDPLGYDGLYDPEGRAYPDIAAQGLNFTYLPPWLTSG
jgi:tripeptidyl-peptidase I